MKIGKKIEKCLNGKRVCCGNYGRSHIITGSSGALQKFEISRKDLSSVIFEIVLLLVSNFAKYWQQNMDREAA